jgi:hypothetical protein
MAALCRRILQASLVYVNTLMLQDVLAEPDWAKLLGPADRRGLTPLFWQHVRPYGEVRLDLGSLLDIGNPSDDGRRPMTRSPVIPSAAHGPDHLGDGPQDRGAVPRRGVLQRHHDDPHRRAGNDQQARHGGILIGAGFGIGHQSYCDDIHDAPLLFTAPDSGRLRPSSAARSTAEKPYQHRERRLGALVGREPHEPEPAPRQHRAEHMQPAQAAPVDHQMLTR